MMGQYEILEVLHKATEPLNSKEIADQLPFVNRQSVQNGLRKLSRSGFVTKILVKGQGYAYVIRDVKVQKPKNKKKVVK